MMPRFQGSAFAHLSDFGRPDVGRIDPAEQMKAAYDEGYQAGTADGRNEAQADCDLRLTEAGFLFETQRNEDSANWHRECTDVLIAALEKATTSIEARIETQVATLLRPWLTERLRDKAIDGLHEAIGRALTSGVIVTIEAPADILSRLKDRLAINAFAIEYVEAATSDIRATIGDTAIEANIAAWLGELTELSS